MKKASDILKLFEEDESPGDMDRGVESIDSMDLESVDDIDPKTGKKKHKKYTSVGGILPYNIGVGPAVDNDGPDGDGDEDDSGTVAPTVSEGLHFNTRIKMLEASHHPVKVRLALKEAHRMVENILDDDHPSPNPADADSQKVLESVSKKIGQIREAMKSVQVRRRVPK